MRTSRSLTLIATGAVATAVLAGCGHTQSASAADVVHNAYGKTSGAKSAKISLTEKISANGQSQTIQGSGVESFADKRGNLTLNAAGQSIQVRFLDDTIYEHLPAALQSKLGGKPWVKIDLNAVAQQKYGQTLQQLSSSTPSDPGATLAYLRGASSSVTKVGTTTIDGTKTTQYKASLDLDKSATTAAAKKAVTKLESQLGTHTIPANVWVDGQGRVRRLTLTETIKHPGGTSSTGPVSLQVTENLSDFGTAVNVSAPPDGQTADLTAKVASAGN